MCHCGKTVCSISIFPNSSISFTMMVDADSYYVITFFFDIDFENDRSLLCLESHGFHNADGTRCLLVPNFYPGSLMIIGKSNYRALL